MISKIILILVLSIIIINFLCTIDPKNETEEEQEQKQEQIIEESKKKKVTFNLNKNEIYNFETFNCGSKQKKNFFIKPVNKKSIVNKKPYFDEKVYGQSILEDSSFFVDKHVIPNYQREYVDKLKSYDKDIHENIFVGQEPYWDSVNISNYNKINDRNVDKLNNFRNGEIKSEKISNVYDYLTSKSDRDLANNFSKSFTGFNKSDSNNINQIYSNPLKHSDEHIFSNFDNKYYGYQDNCAK